MTMAKLKKLLRKTIAEKEEIAVDGYLDTLDHQSRAIYFAGINKGVANTCKSVLKELEALEKSNKAKNKKFTKPTVDEIKDYCAERKNDIDANNFWDYYEARDWVLTNRQKMKCWKSAVRTWERSDFDPPKSRAKPTRTEPIPDWLKEQKQEVITTGGASTGSGNDEGALARIEAIKKQMSG